MSSRVGVLTSSGPGAVGVSATVVGMIGGRGPESSAMMKWFCRHSPETQKQ